MRDFDHILNWELKKGSHTFPGPEGGTCINEAAIVAAGFEYKAVGSAHDCPPCFSRPFAAYALALNDYMPDAVRNRLLTPFVVRLAGTADTAEIEQQRLDYMRVESVRRILPIWLRKAGLEANALACEQVTNRSEALQAARDAQFSTRELLERRAEAFRAKGGKIAWSLSVWGYPLITQLELPASAATSGGDAGAAAAVAVAAVAVAVAVVAVVVAVEAVAVRRHLKTPPEVWEIAVSILDGAMKIGRQPEAIDMAAIQVRMDAARQAVRA